MTAALFYEGLEWNYYYCYECGRWFRRHFRYRYVVSNVDDKADITLLTKKIESEEQGLDAQLETLSWLKKKVAAASRFFQRFLP